MTGFDVLWWQFVDQFNREKFKRVMLPEMMVFQSCMAKFKVLVQDVEKLDEY